MTKVEKRCPRCLETKAAAEFGRVTRRSGPKSGSTWLASHCKPCTKELSKLNRHKTLILNGASAVRILAQKARGRAKNTRKRKEGLSGDLTVDFLVALWDKQGGLCAVSGLPLICKVGPLSPFTPSLDRVDNARGYEESNVRWVLYGVNALKGVGTDTDMLKIAEAIVTKSKT